VRKNITQEKQQNRLQNAKGDKKMLGTGGLKV
jgi:hypothetical protein